MVDLYDLWFFLQMAILPDKKTLEARLRKPDYSRLVKGTEHFVGKTTADFYDFIRRHVSSLTDAEIRLSLSDYLPPEETEGLAMQFSAALVKLR